MSEPKFTKGPWQIDDDEGALRLFLYNEEHGNICTVSLFDQRDREAVLLGETPEDDPNKKEYQDFDKIYANAALIAAAPEMYAMLEELYDNLNRGMKYIISRRVKNGCSIDLARKCSASNIELARRIKALLKKARGEE